MTEAVRPAALLPFPEVYTWVCRMRKGTAHQPLHDPGAHGATAGERDSSAPQPEVLEEGQSPGGKPLSTCQKHAKQDYCAVPSLRRSSCDVAEGL